MKSNKEKTTRETKFIRGMGKVLILLANQANKRGYFDKDEQETLKRVGSSILFEGCSIDYKDLVK